MYTLYTSPSTAGFAAHWLLIELDANHQVIMLDLEQGEQREPAFLKLNQAGTVPVLRYDDVVLCEVAAILIHLAERHPEAGLAPMPGDALRAEYLQWMASLANTLQSAFRARTYTDGARGPSEESVIRNAAYRRADAYFDLLDERMKGRSFLVGGSFSVADIYLTMLLRWSRRNPKPATEWVNLSAYINRMRRMESLKLVHEREELTDWIGD